MTYRLFWVILLFTGACSLFKKADQPVVVDRPSDKPTRTDTAAVVTPADTATPVVDTQPETKPPRKDTLQVAIMLPFSVDKTFMDDFDMEMRTTRYRPLIATELYEGMLLALEALESETLHLRVEVFDTKNNVGEIRYILAQRRMKDMDLIIGPLFPKNLDIVSEFSRDNQIPLISPYASIITIASPNPYYLNLMPTVWSHIQNIAAYLTDNHALDNILLIHSNSENDKKMADDLLTAMTNLAPYENVSPAIKLEASSNGFFDSAKLSPDRTNWVVATSYNEVFLNNLLRQLDQYGQSNTIRLVGMPGWLDNFESLRFDYLNNLQLHITEGLAADTTLPTWKTMDARYRERFGFAPSQQVITGFEAAYTGIQLVWQELHPAPVKTTTFQGVTNGVQYIPFYTPISAEEPMFRVNDRVQWYRYKDYLLEPLR